ncbi:hypothetical protein PIB30_101742, partial [Stylosanthes scabra]|nr:hypothetical protein [Stylosanthes scabra]
MNDAYASGTQISYECELRMFLSTKRCHKSLQPDLKISSTGLGSFSLGIEILWLANGCESIGVAM